MYSPDELLLKLHEHSNHIKRVVSDSCTLVAVVGGDIFNLSKAMPTEFDSIPENRRVFWGNLLVVVYSYTYI